MVNKDEARRIAGITANLPEDYKEYTRRDQYGYHMFPPTQSLGGRAELVDEAKKKQEEAKEEWKSMIMFIQ